MNVRIKTIISKQKLKFSKPPAGQKCSEVHPEVIFFLFWKLQHQLDRESKPWDAGQTEIWGQDGCCCRPRKGALLRMGAPKTTMLPALSWMFWEPGSHWLWDGLWDAATSAAKRPKFQPGKLTSFSSSPGKLTESYLSQRPLVWMRLLNYSYPSVTSQVFVSWHFQGCTWKNMINLIFTLPAFLTIF